MKKIKVGIVGYGNLGKALEELLYFDKRFKLISIFSRRNVEGKYVQVDDYKNIELYKNKIDLMFLAGGSSSNLMTQAERCLNNFCTIDAFDTHKKIEEHIKNCDLLAKKNHKTAFCSFGWDPGLFSIYRVLTKSIEGSVVTSWGKGVSQGHTEALKTIPEIIDAVEYTVPISHKINALKNNKTLDTSALHLRVCYVYTHADKKEVEKKILDLQNYFKGENVCVHFVDKNNIKRHKKFFHSGEVFSVGSEMEFKIKTKSNPLFTAKILIAFSIPLFDMYSNKNYGAFSPLDIPIKKLLKNSEKLI